MSAADRYVDVEAETLKGRLQRRVKLRKWKTGRAYVLDLRKSNYPGRGVITLRDPEAPGWPDRGPTAETLDEALRYARAYVDRLGCDWFTQHRQPRTVELVARNYLAGLEENAPRNTFVNRRSAVTKHILPKFATLMLESLVADKVGAWLKGLKRDDGEPMASSTLETILATLGEMWRFEFPGRPTPWLGKISLASENGAQLRRALAQGEEREESDDGYDARKLRKILRRAQYQDAKLFQDPKKHRAVPDSAYVIAFLFYLGLRAEELTFLRRKDVHLGRRLIFVSGTKTAGARRYVPIQEAFRPWLMDILERTPNNPSAFLFYHSDLHGPARVDTLKGRITSVLKAAKLKRPGEASHVFRGSHISIGLGSGKVGKEDMDRAMGHTDGSVRDRNYLIPAVWAASLQPSHFDYLPHLGEPGGREMLVEDRLRRESWNAARAEKKQRKEQRKPKGTLF